MAKRDALGRFLPGSSGNELGRRPAKWQHELQQLYLKATFDAVSESDWAAIIETCIRDARAGSNLARSFLARYILPSEAQLQMLLQRDEEVRIIVTYEGGPESEQGRVIDHERIE